MTAVMIAASTGRARTTLVALTLMLVSSACRDSSLALTVALPAALDERDRDALTLVASIYAPRTPVSCADVAFRDVTQEQLAPALVSSARLDAAAGTLGDVPIAGDKLALVTATLDADGDVADVVVLEGCGAIGTLKDDATLAITLEHTVRISAAASMPAQIVVPDRGGMVLEVRRAIDGAAAADHAVRIDLEPAHAALDVLTADDGIATGEVVTAVSGPFRARARARLQVGPFVDRVGFMQPPTAPAPLSAQPDVTELHPLVLDGRAAIVTISHGGARARIARAPVSPGGSWQESIILGDGDGAVSLSFVARAVLDGVENFLFTDDVDRDPRTPPELMRAVPGVGVVPLSVPLRFERPTAVAVGPCTDVDAAPIVLVARDGTQLALIDDAGDVVVPSDMDDALTTTPIASFCPGANVGRGVALLQRGSRLAVVQLPTGLDATLPLLPQLAAAEATPGAVAFGEERGPAGGLVVARLENVEVRVERRPAPDGRSIPLPGGAIAVGAARLFHPESTQLFAVVALVGANGVGDGAPILVVEGSGAVSGLAASLPLPGCAPALTCTVVAADADGDGYDELIVAHTRSTTAPDVDPPLVQILDFNGATD